MKPVTIYTTAWCPYCSAAKSLLRDKGIAFTEIDVVRMLERFRREAGASDISFDTICGSGPNGAIVHYRVTQATDRAVRAGDLLLLDSGGQYEDGTTDITRTVPVGPAPAGARDAYTRVLQGMIGLSRLRFPRGVSGRDIDAVRSGDLAVFRTAGAYGATMASTYNSRALVPEVLVDGDRFAVVADRVEPAAMIAAERVPDWL